MLVLSAMGDSGSAAGRVTVRRGFEKDILKKLAGGEVDRLKQEWLSVSRDLLQQVWLAQVGSFGVVWWRQDQGKMVCESQPQQSTDLSMDEEQLDKDCRAPKRDGVPVVKWKKVQKAAGAECVVGTGNGCIPYSVD
jgi:hypothetical protein